ncbi:hypothetical protein Anapl_06441 [Anas platyrhynchos]|uniref:Uncharacterized protein n=1 Tax=Anas platyrhynchos TaxID=8839 RepID=R0M2W0_ANAPL|nr:hypothetical protein Anapl_06441 [Anas platyrhynchos]
MLVLRHLGRVDVQAYVLSTDWFCQHCNLEALPLGLGSSASLCRHNPELHWLKVGERKRERAKAGETRQCADSAGHISHLQPGSKHWGLSAQHSWSLGAVVAEIVAENYEASGGRGEAETEAWKKENTQAGREEGALSFSKDLDDFQDWEFEFGCMSWLDSKNVPCAWSREVYVSFSPVGSKHLWDTGGLQTVLQETVGTPHPTCAMHRRPAGKRNKPNPRRHEGMSPHLVMHCVMRCQSLAVEEGADRRAVLAASSSVALTAARNLAQSLRNPGSRSAPEAWYPSDPADTSSTKEVFGTGHSL